jgi:zinc D-Ala-D-Ala carboxypeptidase
MMQLSEHFHLSEFVRSDIARIHDLSNVPPPEVIRKLQLMCRMVLEPVRLHINAPVHISSGYRSPVVNQLAGGVSSSQHCLGEACDIWTGAMDADQLFEVIQRQVPEWDQLYLNRRDAFIHIAYRLGKNRNQILPIID